MKLTDEEIIEKFKHLYEQYVDRCEVRVDGEDQRFVHAEYSHPRYKRTWLPVTFCGLPVRCAPASARSA